MRTEKEMFALFETIAASDDRIRVMTLRETMIKAAGMVSDS